MKTIKTVSKEYIRYPIPFDIANVLKAYVPIEIKNIKTSLNPIPKSLKSNADIRSHNNDDNIVPIA